MESRPKTGLVSLPPEIIGLVTQNLDWKDIMRILSLGNRQLMDKLGRDGSIRNLEINLASASSEPPKSWIPLSNAAHLHSFRMKVDEYRQLKEFKLEYLPKSLVEIEILSVLECPKMHHHFPSWLLVNLGEIFPNMHSFSIDMELNPSTSDWFSTLPPSLTFLQIGALVDVDVFPSSLCSIHVRNVSKISTNLQFPPTLTDLKWVGNEENEWRLILTILPPTIEKLHLNYSKYMCRAELPVEMLPQSLLTLRIDSFWLFPKTPSIPFPPRLTSLKTILIDSLDSLKYLPESLTDVRVILEHWGPNLPFFDFFALLPSQLLHFESKFIDFLSCPCTSEKCLTIPKGLQTLVIPHVDFTGPLLDSIPPTITYLAIGNIIHCDGNLPPWPLMKEMRVKTMPLNFQILSKLAISSPLLSFFSSRSNPDIPDHASISNTPQLPESTEGNADIPILAPFRFSSHLMTLMTPNQIDHDPNVLLLTLPNSIEVLNLRQVGFSDLGLQSLISCFKLIKLVLQNASMVTGAVFKHLPRSLLVLNVNAAQEIENNEIGDLPPRITFLSINSAIYLTNECAEYMPPTIANLMIIQNKIITRQFLGLLPPSVEISPFKMMCSQFSKF